MAIFLDNLESHLFKCADIIHDAVDPTYYKEYILPFVYYKFISEELETGMMFHDPTVGSGGMLIEAVPYTGGQNENSLEQIASV